MLGTILLEFDTQYKSLDFVLLRVSVCVYNREGDKVSARSERTGQISEKPPCFRSGPIFGHHTYLRKSIMMANSSLPALTRAMTEMIFEMKMAVMMSVRIVIIMMIVVTMVRKWRRSLCFFIC